MQKRITLLTLVPLLLSIGVYSTAHASANTSQWKLPSGTVYTGPLFSATRPECREFASYSTKHWNSSPDGFIVAKEGKIQFEYYDSVYGPNRPHALWSVSKTFTGVLLGIAVRDGKVSLDQKLSEFYPREKQDPAYESIKVSNLFYSDTGFLWNESTQDITRNSTLLTLFAQHRVDMPNYVAHREVISEGAGYRWQYNTGTPILAMGILRKTYGEEYNAFPWKELFNPLGMKSVTFEQDVAGNFVGGAYVFATPRDMLKLGQLLLNRGQWNGQTILTDDWISRALTISPGYLQPGTTREQIKNGLNLVYGGLVWLNRHGRPDLPKPFPKSPDDMFMALGQYGQFILILPTQKMVLVRTGREGTIDDRIDGIVTRALACFDDPSTLLADSPPSKGQKNKSPSLSQTYRIVRDGMKSGLLQGFLAKWLCSCHFTSKLSIDSCLDRSNIPHANALVKVTVNTGSISVKPSKAAELITKAHFTRTAAYDSSQPQLGCWLLP